MVLVPRSTKLAYLNPIEAAAPDFKHQFFAFYGALAYSTGSQSGLQRKEGLLYPISSTAPFQITVVQYQLIRTIISMDKCLLKIIS